MSKQTPIDEVAGQVATIKPMHRADETRARGSMADVEKIHGTRPGPTPAEVKAKAAKAKIDCAAFGVEDGTPAPIVAPKPPAKK